MFKKKHVQPNIMKDNEVFVYKLNKIEYPKIKPYHPNQKYPEYKYNEFSKENNYVYESLRNSLYLMGLDRDHWNTEFWNPFNNIIKPKDIVLIIPNLVINKDSFLDCLTTHPSIILAIVDYVLIALKGSGKI